MSETIERIRDAAKPPGLPPYLRGHGWRRSGVVIMPDICHAEVSTRTQHANTWTIHYVWMVRLDLDTGHIQRAHVNCRAYRQWLETYLLKDGVPPHIAFGGAVVSSKGDPEFHSRWVEYAKEMFC